MKVQRSFRSSDSVFLSSGERAGFIWSSSEGGIEACRFEQNGFNLRHPGKGCQNWTRPGVVLRILANPEAVSNSLSRLGWNQLRKA